jgi:hypothetical protein
MIRSDHAQLARHVSRPLQREGNTGCAHRARSLARTLRRAVCPQIALHEPLQLGLPVLGA